MNKKFLNRIKLKIKEKKFLFKNKNKIKVNITLLKTENYSLIKAFSISTRRNILVYNIKEDKYINTMALGLSTDLNGKKYLHFNNSKELILDFDSVNTFIRKNNEN